MASGFPTKSNYIKFYRTPKKHIWPSKNDLEIVDAKWLQLSCWLWACTRAGCKGAGTCALVLAPVARPRLGVVGKPWASLLACLGHILGNSLGIHGALWRARVKCQGVGLWRVAYWHMGTMYGVPKEILPLAFMGDNDIYNGTAICSNCGIWCLRDCHERLGSRRINWIGWWDLEQNSIILLNGEMVIAIRF